MSGVFYFKENDSQENNEADNKFSDLKPSEEHVYIENIEQAI